MGVTLFFLEKYDDLLVIASESDELMTFFICRLLTTPIFLRRFSSLLNSATKNHFSRASPPGGCHTGRSAPLVTSLSSSVTRGSGGSPPGGDTR